MACRGVSVNQARFAVTDFFCRLRRSTRSATALSRTMLNLQQLLERVFQQPNRSSCDKAVLGRIWEAFTTWCQEQFDAKLGVKMLGMGEFCMRHDVIGSLEGVGTGKLSETYPACVAAGVTFYVSGMSCKARGITPESLATKNAGGGPVTFEMPPKLLELTFAADSTLSF